MIGIAHARASHRPRPNDSSRTNKSPSSANSSPFPSNPYKYPQGVIHYQKLTCVLFSTRCLVCKRRGSSLVGGYFDVERIPHESKTWVYLDRAAGRHRDHRGADRAVAAGGAVGSRGRAAGPVRQQSQADGDWPFRITTMRFWSFLRDISPRASSSTARPTPHRAGAGRR